MLLKKQDSFEDLNSDQARPFLMSAITNAGNGMQWSFMQLDTSLIGSDEALYDFL